MYRNFEEWFAQSEQTGEPLAQIVMAEEMRIGECRRQEVYDKLRARWQVMKASAQKALGEPIGGKKNLVAGQATRQWRYATKGGMTGEALNRMMAMALSASEVNASMGRICAAPTAGACGVLPAVLVTAFEQIQTNERRLLDALLVSAGIGAIITMNATVSGAEGGCQAECGSAAAMAAGAVVTMAGGDNAMVGSAVSLALMNCMGLVCDPIAGLVQIPCSYRNASQAMNAMLSADLALAGQNAFITPDEAVLTMYRVGKKLPTELKETALGGIADTPTGQRIAGEMLNM